MFGLKQRYRKYTKYLQETHSNARVITVFDMGEGAIARGGLRIGVCVFEFALYFLPCFKIDKKVNL